MRYLQGHSVLGFKGLNRKLVHRRDAEDAEITQRNTINSLRPLCVLCVSAVNGNQERQKQLISPSKSAKYILHRFWVQHVLSVILGM